MELRNEIEKDAKQFFREKRTLILLFAAPVIVLLILGGVFGRTTQEAGGAEIGLCDLDKSNLSNLFVAGITNSTKIADHSSETKCDLTVEKEVREGRLAAAIVIPKGFQNGIESGVSQNLTVYIDNSRILTSSSIEAFMKAAVQETGQKVGTQFILTVWTKLNSADSQLKGLLFKINDSRADALKMKKRLNQTTNSLQAINFSTMNDELKAANSTIISTLTSLESVESNLSKIESSFAEYDSELNQSEAELLQIRSTLANASAYISNAKSGINCSNLLFSAFCFSLDSLNSTIGSAVISVEDRVAKVRKARQGISEANATIQDFKAGINDTKAGAKEAELRIENMSKFVYSLERNRADALSTINEVDSSLDELLNKSYELEDIIKKSSAQIKEITSRNPESVISPILLSPNRLFGKRTFFDLLLPSLLPMILMFVSLFLSSTALVRDKNNGTLGRMQLSQVNSFEFSAKKVISYTIVLIPEALLLTIIASVVYGALPLFDIGTAIFVFETLVLLMLAFISIGVVIAIYSESEVTAFLASLVIGLPLLFLSGLVFPLEFMPATIAAIGAASPLTQAVFSMQSVMLYNSPQAIGFGILLLYATVFTIIAAISMRRVR